MVSSRIDIENVSATTAQKTMSPATAALVTRHIHLLIEALRRGRGNASPPNRTVNCRRAHE